MSNRSYSGYDWRRDFVKVNLTELFMWQAIGSAFKPFVYTAAMENGFTTNSI
jgi:membrane carboxypeptidase/penicillin-binding protein